MKARISLAAFALAAVLTTSVAMPALAGIERPSSGRAVPSLSLDPPCERVVIG
jgi:hypothetical protein